MAISLLGMAFVCRASEVQWYHINRRFEPVGFDNMGTPTVFKVIQGSRELTGIVGPFSVRVLGQMATEHDCIALGYPSAQEAWQAVLSGGGSEDYPDVMYDNVGWVKGTKQAHGEWDAHMWFLQNEIAFETSTTAVYATTSAVAVIDQVLVGTLGDYPPCTTITDVGPTNHLKDYPGANNSDDQTFKADLTAYYKITPLSVELACDDAVSSPKPFKFGKTEVESPCGKSADQAEALTVYYNQVFDYGSTQVRNFDIALKVLPAGMQGVQWSKISGPNSGSLLNADHAEATFQNPKKGGVYQLDATVAGVATRTQVWLPMAGPDITLWFKDELAYLHGLAWNYNANVTASRKEGITDVILRASDVQLALVGADWLGQFTSEHGPCGGPVSYNVFDARHTIAGVVVERHKLSNMLAAYLAREILWFWPEELIVDHMGDGGSPDLAYSRAAYHAAFEIYSGGSVEDAITAHGYEMQAPSSWADKEWPNYELATGGGITRPPSIASLNR